MIHRLRKRDLFAFAGETIIRPSQISQLLGPRKHCEEEMKKELLTTINAEGNTLQIGEDDIFPQIVQIGYGKGNANPVSCSSFYALNKDPSDGINNKNVQRWKVGVIPDGKGLFLLLRNNKMMILLVY
jgi:hypothetical protein